MFWIGFLVGIFAGELLCVLAIALCRMAAEGEGNE